MFTYELRGFEGIPRIQLTFKDQVEKELICRSCHCIAPLLYRDPELHGFCEDCKDEMIFEDTFHCRLFGTHELDEIFEDDSIYYHIREKIVVCPNIKFGCHAVLTLQELKEHAETCLESTPPSEDEDETKESLSLDTIQCPLCKQHQEKHLLLKHMKEYCNEREVTCYTCQQNFRAMEIPDHQKICGFQQAVHSQNPIKLNDREIQFQNEFQELKAGLEKLNSNFTQFREYYTKDMEESRQRISFLENAVSELRNHVLEGTSSNQPAKVKCSWCDQILPSLDITDHMENLCLQRKPQRRNENRDQIREETSPEVQKPIEPESKEFEIANNPEKGAKLEIDSDDDSSFEELTAVSEDDSDLNKNVSLKEISDTYPGSEQQNLNETHKEAKADAPEFQQESNLESEDINSATAVNRTPGAVDSVDEINSKLSSDEGSSSSRGKFDERESGSEPNLTGFSESSQYHITADNIDSNSEIDLFHSEQFKEATDAALKNTSEEFSYGLSEESEKNENDTEPNLPDTSKIGEDHRLADSSDFYIKDAVPLEQLKETSRAVSDTNLTTVTCSLCNLKVNPKLVVSHLQEECEFRDLSITPEVNLTDTEQQNDQKIFEESESSEDKATTEGTETYGISFPEFKKAEDEASKSSDAPPATANCDSDLISFGSENQSWVQVQIEKGTRNQEELLEEPLIKTAQTPETDKEKAKPEADVLPEMKETTV